MEKYSFLFKSTDYEAHGRSFSSNDIIYCYDRLTTTQTIWLYNFNSVWGTVSNDLYIKYGEI